MAFRYAVFPECRKFGAVASVQHNVAVVKLRSGVEYRTSRGDGGLRRFEFVYGLASQYDELAAANSFLLTMGGAADSFLLRDYFDHNSSVSGHGPTTPTDQLIGTGNGVITGFQIIKSYTTRDPAGALVAFKVRDIEHPKALSVTAAIDGTTTTAFSVNLYTGVITFTTAPPIGAAVTVGYEFYVPVRFSDETSASFDVSLVAQDAGEVSVSMVEVPGEGAYSTDIPYGGHYDGSAMNSDIRLAMGDGGFIDLNPQQTGLRVFLPNVKNVGEGIGHMWITNSSGAYTLDLFPFEGGTALTTIPTATGAPLIPAVVVLGLKDSGANKVWVAFQ